MATKDTFKVPTFVFTAEHAHFFLPKHKRRSIKELVGDEDYKEVQFEIGPPIKETYILKLLEADAELPDSQLIHLLEEVFRLGQLNPLPQD
ncbi:MAG TPA: hypothetical protein VHA78_01925 [Candidatus Peribacteraceae bacterium]|nr:hypothetical protein [Candidatus Peribacteraceae bacterium]